jgi:hypothetical protein
MYSLFVPNYFLCRLHGKETTEEEKNGIKNKINSIIYTKHFPRKIMRKNHLKRTYQQNYKNNENSGKIRIISCICEIFY